MGKIDLSVATAKALPAFLGEVDVLKNIAINAWRKKCR
jgi:hypothetical protein